MEEYDNLFIQGAFQIAEPSYMFLAHGKYSQTSEIKTTKGQRQMSVKRGVSTSKFQVKDPVLNYLISIYAIPTCRLSSILHVLLL